MATQRKAAPGPWKWKYRDAGYYELEAADGSIVHSDGSACGEYGRDVDAPDGPNARLIAAAPDMYEALADCIVSLCAANLEHLPALVKARAALAKAEGRDVP